jgi:hypothetical protein
MKRKPDKLPLEYLLEDDDFRQGKGDHGHREGQHRAERRSLLEKRLDDWDEAGGVRVHGDAEQHGETRGPLAAPRKHRIP